MKIYLYTTIRTILIAVLIGCSLAPLQSSAQKVTADSSKMAEAGVKKEAYPKAVGYLIFIFPLVTVAGTTTYNFIASTSIGFPGGDNALYSDKFGFSYDFT